MNALRRLVCLLLSGCIGIASAPQATPGAAPNAPQQPAPGPTPPTPSPNSPVDCTQPREPGPALVRRLTKEEYLKTVKAALGVDLSDRAALVPSELRAEGFSNTATAAIVSFSHIDGYAKLAQEATVRVSNWPALVASVASCSDTTDACARLIIGGLGRRLYRRPLTNDEVDRIVPLAATVRAENDSHVVLAQLAVERMLQSPQFLYRLEKQRSGTSIRDLDGYELATRISYLVTQGPPDEPLLTAAGAGQLSTTQGIADQIRRLAATASAKEAARSFARDWLRLDAIDSMQRMSPAFTPRLATDMKEETLKLFDSVLWESKSPLTHLIEAPYTFLSPELASFYGFSPGNGSQRHELTADMKRGGILTHAGVLAISGGSDTPSLVGRALYVFENILCQHVAAPSAQIMAMMNMGAVAPGKTQRFYSEARLARPECAGCHQQFDAFGYPFEGFNGLGQHQTTDAFGNQLRSDGTVNDPDSQLTLSFQTPKDFVTGLAKSELVQRCLTQKPFQYAVGRPLEAADACTIADIRREASRAGNTYVSLLTAIATHATFRTIRAE
jgi:hypothetical protein